MWSKIKSIVTIVGWAIAGFFILFYKRLFRRAPASAEAAPEAKPTAGDLITKQQPLKGQLNDKLNNIATQTEEAADEKTISDLITDYNDLYNN